MADLTREEAELTGSEIYRRQRDYVLRAELVNSLAELQRTGSLPTMVLMPRECLDELMKARELTSGDAGGE